jgi:hypothetical protein
VDDRCNLLFDLFDVTPENLFAYALGQLIFDTDNPKSMMHGHSLGRSMYGSPGGTVVALLSGGIDSAPGP